MKKYTWFITKIEVSNQTIRYNPGIEISSDEQICLNFDTKPITIVVKPKKKKLNKSKSKTN
jgi:hypothetical protein